MVILHILIAIASIVVATINIFSPTKAKLIGSYSLIAATLLSGTALVVIEPSRMVHVCVTGLVYVVFASVLTIAANVRLARMQGKVKA
jgi:hypothetical protein